jgi:F420-non-reducing hydrogenase iron-sulfur subunit
MSGAEASLFVESVNDFVKKVKELGPLGKGEAIDGEGLKSKLATVTELIPYIRLVERERLRVTTLKSEEEYREFFASDEVNKLFTELIGDQLAIGQIVSLLRERPLSTGKIAEMLGLTPSEVSRHMNTSSRHGLVRYDVDQKCYALA